MLHYWIFRSNVFCSTSRACLCVGLARSVSRRCVSLRTRGVFFRRQIFVPLCKEIRVDNSHTAYWTMIKRLDIMDPHVVLLVALCGDRLVHRTPFKPMRDRSVPRIEPQVERQLVCTRTIRSRPNVHPRTSSPALLLCFSEGQVQKLRSQLRHLELVLPFSRSVQRQSSLKLLPKIAICNLFQRFTRRCECLRKRTKHFACFLGARTRFLHQRLCCRARSRTQCLGLRATISPSMSRGEDTSSLVPCDLCQGTFTRLWRHEFHIIARLSQQFVLQVLGCLDHVRVRLTSNIASMWAMGQCISALVEVSESLCQFIMVSRVCARLARCDRSTCRSQTPVSGATLTEAFPSWSLSGTRTVFSVMSYRRCGCVVGFESRLPYENMKKK